jgi:hypothetical protein
MATEMFKTDDDFLLIAIVCHRAHSRPIKFCKLNIYSEGQNRNSAHSYKSNSTQLFENLNSLSCDNFYNKQQMTTYSNSVLWLRKLDADLLAMTAFPS